MVTLFFFLAAGFLSGILLRQRPGVHKTTQRLMSYSIFLLLFLLGHSVGINRDLLQQLPLLGWQALLISSSAILGSGALAWLFWRLWFGKSNP